MSNTSNLTPEERAAELESLERVRRRVLSICFFAVSIHAVLGIIGVAGVIDGQDRRDGAIILLIISAIVMQLIVAVIRVILRRPPFSLLWFAVGLIPPAIGVWWVLIR